MQVQLDDARAITEGDQGVRVVQRVSGERLFFRRRTGEFAILGSDRRTIVTYMNPDKPDVYWKGLVDEALLGGGRWIKQ